MVVHQFQIVIGQSLIGRTSSLRKEVRHTGQLWFSRRPRHSEHRGCPHGVSSLLSSLSRQTLHCLSLRSCSFSADVHITYCTQTCVRRNLYTKWLMVEQNELLSVWWRSLDVTKCEVKNGTRVDHFWPLRYRFCHLIANISNVMSIRA